MEKWFPFAKYCVDGPPRLRLLCFHGAGSDSTIFTSKGSLRKPLPNTLLPYCEENDVELLPVHLPGRTIRSAEKRITNTSQVAAEVFDVLAQAGVVTERKKKKESAPAKNDRKDADNNEEDAVPLVVAGHSMGCICAFEFVRLLHQREFHLPKRMLMSCMVSPDMPDEDRPWRKCELLDAKEMKDECRSWNINEEVFSPQIWEIYEPILRDDFKVIDNYKYQPLAENYRVDSTDFKNYDFIKLPPLEISTTVFYGKNDKRITEQMVMAWKRILTPSLSEKERDMGGQNGKQNENDSENLQPPTQANSIKKNEIGDPFLNLSPRPNVEFLCHCISGGHNFFYEALARAEWMAVVTGILDRLLIDMDYGF